MTDYETLAHRYWTLANYVVGFVAVQTLAFMYLIAQVESEIRDAMLTSKLVGVCILVGVVLTTVIYLYLLKGCWKAESDLLETPGKNHDWGKRDYQARKRLVILIQAAGGAVFLLISNLNPISFLTGTCN